MGTTKRKFARGHGGTASIATACPRSPHTLATTCREAEVLRVLDEQAGWVSESWVPRPEKVRSLLEAAFARPLDNLDLRLSAELNEGVRAAADTLWTFYCHADDAPTACGVPDPRFAYYWTTDERQECPLVECCKAYADWATR